VRGEELRDLGYGGLWGVGQAAEEAPALVVLSYDPAQGEGGGVATANPESVAWVGKGIVYDTGGLSLKVRKKNIVMILEAVLVFPCHREHPA